MSQRMRDRTDFWSKYILLLGLLNGSNWHTRTAVLQTVWNNVFGDGGYCQYLTGRAIRPHRTV